MQYIPTLQNPPSDAPPEYAILERLVDWPGTVVYRGFRRSDGRAVLLETIESRQGARANTDFHHEQAILLLLSGTSVVHALGHEEVDGRHWLVLEDVGGQPLSAIVAYHRAPDRAIVLGLAIAHALAEVHRRGVVHQHLDPRHVLVLDDASVRLLGFGNAGRRFGEAHARALDRSLGYLAPEQTGRLHRQVDQRADLYALGIVLYEILTGALPFEASDAAGWIHAHLATVPAAPHTIDQRIPSSLSAIVLTLLAKDPLDRYQHALGLVHDLERCLRALERGDQQPFPLRTDDVTDEFRVSVRLHGREREVAALIAGLERAIIGAVCVVSLAPGYSGIGKTSVVATLYQPVARERGLFIAGKFDQYNRDIPYATLVEAFRGLMREVLAANEDALADWRRRLHAALGANAGVLAIVIPELEAALGPLPSTAQLGPREAQNRFETAFLAFVRVFARTDNPLVLFLDDMQWADDATLGLLQLLAMPATIPSLQLVLAYRDNEVGTGHPFQLVIESLRAGGTIIDVIPIRELEHRHVLALVADTVRRPTDDAAVAVLADQLFQKTAGNPFFIRELLQQLHDRGLLTFDPSARCWNWDRRATDAIDIAGSVIDLLVARFSNLTSQAQRTLAVAACFGNRFAIDSLALTLPAPADEVASVLSSAREAGFIVALADGEHVPTFRFHHDRIQQAAYSLLSGDERTVAHLQIGRVLLTRFRDGADELLFDVVEHLNRGSILVVGREERRELFQLTLAAGHRARGSAAWAPARAYFDAAMSFAAADAWAGDRDAMFGAVRDLAECEFLTGRFAPAEKHFDDLRVRSTSLVERAGVVTLHVRLLIVSGRYDDAFDLATRELELFGETLPREDSELAAAIEDAYKRLASFDITSMAALPVLGDTEPRALITLLASLPPTVYSRRPALLPLLGMRIVLLSIEYGNCEASCFGYSLYAMILAGTLNAPVRAVELSQASIALSEKLDDPRQRAPAVHIHANHILFWVADYCTGRPLMQSAYEAAMHVGDFTIAAYVAFMGAWQEIERGFQVVETRRALDTHAARAAASQHGTAHDVVRLQIQFGRALAGDTISPVSLSSRDFDADMARERIATAGLDTGLVVHDLLVAMLAWLNGRFADAEASLERGAPTLAAAFCLPLETTWALFDGLTAAANWNDATPERRERLAVRVRNAEARLARWSKNCPENFEAKHGLVRAELARLEGRILDALSGYEQAFAAARRSGALQLQAISAQLATRLALAHGVERAARSWLDDQHHILRAWGATVLAEQLEAEQPHLRTPKEHVVGATQLDGLAAIKASQALTRGITIEDLAHAVLRVVIENAGAQRAVLLSSREGRLQVTAAMPAEASSAIQASHDVVPISIINYVERTRAMLMFADVTAEPTFSVDPYIVRTRARSVLCMPIFIGAELSAVLYLENMLIKGAFSPDRVALIEVVATQLAISLENALLHEERRRAAGELVRRETLRTSEERQAQHLAMIFEQTPVVIAMLRGPDHIFDVANPEYRRVVGGREVLGRPVREALPEIVAQGLIGILDRVYQTGEPFIGKAVVIQLNRGPEGASEEAAFDLVYQALRGPTGQVTGIAVIGHEVTELVVARQSAEAANRSKDEFLAMLGHELRNPLAPIVIALQLMGLRANMGAERERAIIERQVNHLVGLIDDLLDVSRIARGKVDLRIAPVEVADIVARAIEVASPLFDQHRHTLTVDVPRRLFVQGDSERLVQVVSNLVTNAAKYTPNDGRVRVSARRKGDQIEISVVDNGVGIDASMLTQVFEAFAQAPQSIDRAQGGLGLGLAIVANLVKLHGGTVTANSEGRGRGSEFILCLPAIEMPEVALVTSQAPQVVPRGDARVLIVDDNVDAAELLADVLQAGGYQTRAVHDGPSALKAADEFQPQIALLDLGLPVMDGFELAQLLRHRSELATTKLIAITGYGQPEDRAKTAAAGFAAHMVKPVDLAQLRRVMEQLLRPASE